MRSAAPSPAGESPHTHPSQRLQDGAQVSGVDIDTHLLPDAVEVVYARQARQFSRGAIGEGGDHRAGEVPHVQQRARLHDPAFPDDGDPVCQRRHLGENVAGTRPP
ncbi:hypothetical protein GCM10027595_10280 [Corynebacterium nasicanis]